MDTAADLLHDAITVPRDATLELLARRLTTHHIRHLPVVDGDGRLVAMVTDQEVFDRGGFLLDDWVPFEPGFDALTAEALGTTGTPQVAADAPLAQVLRILEGAADCVVVVDEGGRVHGIVTEHDGVRFAAAVLAEDARVDREAAAPVQTVRRESPARTALDLMFQHRVRHVVIEEAERPVGVLSFRDLVIEGIPGGRQLQAWDVVRSTTVHTVTEGTSLRAAARRMAELAVGCLPVVDAAGTLVAIVTRTDVIAAAANALDDEGLFGEG